MQNNMTLKLVIELLIFEDLSLPMFFSDDVSNIKSINSKVDHSPQPIAESCDQHQTIQSSQYHCI